MKTDPNDFRKLYSSLNDEALLAIKREELVPVAQECYDVEVAARGLDAAGDAEEAAHAPADPTQNLVELETFDNPAEANVARSLLRMAEIPCVLSTDLMMGISMLSAAADVTLYVPQEYVEQANEVLDSEISDEDLAAQAEAASLSEEEELEEEQAGTEE